MCPSVPFFAALSRSRFLFTCRIIILNILFREVNETEEKKTHLFYWTTFASIRIPFVRCGDGNSLASNVYAIHAALQCTEMMRCICADLRILFLFV